MSTGAHDVRDVRTGEHDPADQFERWREAVSGRFAPMEATRRGTGPFRASMRTAQVGSITVSEIAAEPHGVRRTRGLIRRSDPDLVKLTLQREGTCRLEQGERRDLLRPGRYAVYDTGHPYSLHFDGCYRALVVMLPRTMLDTAAPVRGASPRVARLATLAEDLLTGRGPGTGLDLVALELLGTAGPTAAARIRAWVEEHLSEPDLAPARIAAAHHISIRQLHKLFAAEGRTVAGWVRARRLERCHRDLLDDRLRDRTISAVAARNGLVDAAQFSRAFRARFGISPREHRHRPVH